MSSTDNTTTSVESAKIYIQDALTSLNSEHPKWKNPESNQATICIPDNFETVRRYIERRNGFKDKKAKVECRGDYAEQKVFDALKSLDIGAIVISNFDMKDFCHKAEAIYEQYQILIERYNETQKACDQMAGKDAVSDMTSQDFECEFILLHRRIGICYIEVKSGCSTGTIKKAQRQVYQVPMKLKLLFHAINETESCKIPIHAAVIFPNDIITENMESTIRNLNPDAHLLGRGKGGFAKPENFRHFWINLMDKSENNDLFKNEHFQRFIAVLCCYRGAVYLNGIQNAVRVAELVQQQLLTPKMNPGKAAQLSTRREVRIGSIDSSPDVIFLTEDQQKVEMCSDRLQLIFGAPGTGKTLLLLLQVLRAAQDAESKGRVIVQCMASFRKKVENFFKSDKYKFARGRKPIVDTGNIDCDIYDRDDIFTDELGTRNEEVNFLVRRIKRPGKTVCVITNDHYPNNYETYRENFASLRKHYTTHILKAVMRGTSNIINYWREFVMGADFFIGHDIAGPNMEPPKKCRTIRETLQAVYDCVKNLIDKGVLPKYIAVITHFSEEEIMIRKFIEKESGKKIDVSGADELVTGKGSVVVDTQTYFLSHEYPFVIVCSLFCPDLVDSLMLVACSRAIVQLTIIERDYLSMQMSIEAYISSHPVSPYSGFTTLKQRVEEAMRLYLDGSSKIHCFVYNVHLFLTVMRLNIFPKYDENSNQKFQSCHSFTDLLEFFMLDPTLMRQVADDFTAYYKKLCPQIQKVNGTVRIPNNFTKRLLSSNDHSENVTSLRNIETYKRFSSKLAESVYDSFSENGELQGNEFVPRIFPWSKNDHEHWRGLLDFLQYIFICRKHYFPPTKGRVIVEAKRPFARTMQCEAVEDVKKFRCLRPQPVRRTIFSAAQNSRELEGRIRIS